MQLQSSEAACQNYMTLLYGVVINTIQVIYCMPNSWLLRLARTIICLPQLYCIQIRLEGK